MTIQVSSATSGETNAIPIDAPKTTTVRSWPTSVARIHSVHTAGRIKRRSRVAPDP